MEIIQAGVPLLAVAAAEFGSSVARATVYVAGAEIPYLRAGSGPPVLLIQTGNDGATALPALLVTLATRFRVIAPSTGALVPLASLADGDACAPVAFSSWLRGFMDGLGLQRASIVTTSPLGVACIGFALAEPERVDRLVLLLRDVPEPAFGGAGLPDRLSESGHPLLLVPTGPKDGDGADAPGPAQAAILRFLGVGT